MYLNDANREIKDNINQNTINIYRVSDIIFSNRCNSHDRKNVLLIEQYLDHMNLINSIFQWTLLMVSTPFTHESLTKKGVLTWLDIEIILHKVIPIYES